MSDRFLDYDGSSLSRCARCKGACYKDQNAQQKVHTICLYLCLYIVFSIPTHVVLCEIVALEISQALLQGP